MVRKRRGRLEIVEKILTIALDGANATRIVYGANLDFRRFRVYSAHLLDKGLLTVEEASGYSRLYRTSEEGRNLLSLLRNVRKLV